MAPTVPPSSISNANSGSAGNPKVTPLLGTVFIAILAIVVVVAITLWYRRSKGTSQQQSDNRNSRVRFDNPLYDAQDNDTVPRESNVGMYADVAVVGDYQDVEPTYQDTEPAFMDNGVAAQSEIPGYVDVAPVAHDDNGYMDVPVHGWDDSDEEV